MDETFGIVFGVFGVVIALMLIMAVFLLNGRGAFLIAGYNTMSTTKKAQFDEKALCRFTGKVLIAISFCLALFPIGMYFEVMWIAFCGIILILPAVVGAVIYINTGGRFRSSAAEDAHVAFDTRPQTIKVVIIAAVIISAVVAAALGITFHQGNKDPEVHIIDDGIQIKAMYGLTIHFSEITDVVLINNNMEAIGIGRRVNGYGGVGDALKGHFKSDDLGKILLFVQSKSSPTLRIGRGDKEDVYISFRSGEQAEQLYFDLIAALK